MNRKNFIKGLCAVPLLSTVSACFTSPQSNLNDEIKGNAGDRFVQIVSVSDNHGHQTVTVEAIHVEDRTPNTYRLLGGDHEHRFDLSQGQMDQLLDGQTITVTARDVHFHQISLHYSASSVISD